MSDMKQERMYVWQLPSKLGKDQVKDNCSGLSKKKTKICGQWKISCGKLALLAPVVTSQITYEFISLYAFSQVSSVVLGIALEEFRTWNQMKYDAPRREPVLWNSKYGISAWIPPPVAVTVRRSSKPDPDRTDWILTFLPCENGVSRTWLCLPCS